MKHFQIMLRNGLGFDIESVDSLPLWIWVDDQDPYEDEPGVGTFNGIIILIPFFKIIVGKFV